MPRKKLKKKKKDIQSITAHWQYPRTQMEMDNEINVVFRSGNTTSFIQLMDQGVTLIFKTFDWGNTIYKSITVIYSDSIDGFEQNQ